MAVVATFVPRSPALAQRSAPVAPANQPVVVTTGLHSRSTALHDPRFALRAMQLTAAQTQALAIVNARYKPAITSYIGTLNTAIARGIPDDSLRPMQDSLHHLLVAVRVATDSVITPAQRKRFQDAMRLIHGASLPARGTAGAPAVSPSRLVPIPTSPKPRP